MQVAGAFFLAQAVDAGSAWAKGAPTPFEKATFAAFLDVLLPRDALSGSTTDLKVHARLWAFARLDANFARLVALGCQWLSMTGGAGFPELPSKQKTAVVRWMSESDWNEVPRRFYELVRLAAIETYYSEQANWADLPLHQPPQPEGYPPPWV